MQTLPFANGDEMPALGLGTWKSSPGEVGTAVEEALRLGYRHLDCAAIYMNEAEIGVALARCFGKGLVAREELWVTSKLWCNSHRDRDVQPAVEQSLRDLGLDYLDLYLVHWPVALKHDVWRPDKPSDFVSLRDIPLEETWGAMQRLLEKGLVRHIGVSNYSAQNLSRHLDEPHPPEMNQVEIHPYLQQPDLVRFAHEHGIHVTGYSPLGSGDRPSSMKAEQEPVLLRDATIQAIAHEADASPAQVMLAWALQRLNAVIPKSVDPDRLRQNLEAADLKLDPSAMERISGIDRARRYITGTFWAPPGSPYSVETLWGEALPR